MLANPNNPLHSRCCQGRRHPRTLPRRKLPDSYPDRFWLLAVAVNILLLLGFLFLFVLLAALSARPVQALDVHIPVPWDEKKPEAGEALPEAEKKPPEREKAPLPPEINPYIIPRFSGKEGGDFHHIPPVKLSKLVDADAVYRMIINCFPERPRWGIDIKAVAGARYTENNTISTIDTAGLSRYYAGIVAEMPLYSAEEQFRVREAETKRRIEAAANIAALLKGLADRDRAARLIGIGESTELRSYVRVQNGIAQAEEQMGYLKEVAGAVAEYDAASAAILSARLALAGQCRDEVYDQVNNYLTEVTR